LELQHILKEIYSGDQIKKNEMGGTCSTYGKGELLTKFWWGNLMERDHLENMGVDGSIILKWIFRKFYWEE